MFLHRQQFYMYSFLNPSVDILYTTSWPFTHLRITKNCGGRGEKWIRLELLQAIRNNHIILFFLTFAKDQKTKVWWQSKEKGCVSTKPQKSLRKQILP